MELHALCELLPEMPADQFARLAEDIKAHGLRHPITTYEGKILDGRHRHRACIQAAVTPRFEPFVGNDPIAYVVGENLRRRHLNPSQMAMVAARLSEYESVLAKERQREHGGTAPGITRTHMDTSDSGKSQGRVSEVLSDRFGIGNGTVIRGIKVLHKGVPELVKKVEAGEITVTEAARIASLKSRDSQRQIVAIDSKVGRVMELQKRSRLSVSKTTGSSTVPAVPGTPYVRRFLSRLEAMTNDLSSEFKTKTSEEMADRFMQEFDRTDPILAAQFRRAMVSMWAVALVVSRSAEDTAA